MQYNDHHKKERYQKPTTVQGETFISYNMS